MARDNRRSSLHRVTQLVGERAQIMAPDTCDVHGIAIGQCGCGGGMAAGNGNFTAVGLQVNPNAAPGVPSWWNGCRPQPGCYPESIQDSAAAAMASALARSPSAQGRLPPYADMAYDFAHMDVLYSEITTVAAGATTPVNVQPVAGTFAAFYYEIVAVDETTQVPSVDWRIAQPQVEGCPTKCNVGSSTILSQLVEKVPEGCCGTPIQAFLDKASEDVPLVVNFTNNQAAGSLLVQVRVRGYCCPTRIC